MELCYNYGVRNTSLATSISEGLNSGDSIIISGNLNLAHDAKVVVVQANKQQ